MSVVEVSAMYGGRLLKLQTGKVAKQADASVLAQYGETVVLVTVVSSRKLGADPSFFPLTVDIKKDIMLREEFLVAFLKEKPSHRKRQRCRLV